MATLSYASDLGLGQPMAHCMRQTVVALRLAGLAGASGQELEATYYLGLMMNVYCHADAAEQARWFGDDISLKSDTFDLLDMSTARMVAFMLRRVGSHGSGVARARRLAAFPVAGMKQVLSFATTHCTLGSQFAEQIGLDEAVCVAIRQGYEQWDGKGYPSHLQGEEICLPARLVQLAGPVEVVARAAACRRRWRWRAGTAGPSTTRRWWTCSAPTRPNCWTAWTGLRIGMRSWAPSRNCRAASVAPAWTWSWRPWPTWLT